MIQGPYDPIKGSVTFCYKYIEHLQGKNRTREQVVDSAKTKTVTGTLHGKVSEQLEISVAFEGIIFVLHNTFLLEQKRN